MAPHRLFRFLPTIMLSALFALLPLGWYGIPLPVAAIEYPPGWNLVAGPDGSTLKGASGFLYTLQPGDSGYEQLPADAKLKGGYGYWAYFPTGGELLRSGGIDHYTVTPSAGGWVLVGNPASWDSATISGADTVLTYTPDGGYQPAKTLKIGQGGWISGTTTVTLTVPPFAPLSLTLLRKVPPGEYDNIPAAHAVFEFQLMGADLRQLNLAVPDEFEQIIRVTSSTGTGLQPAREGGYGYGYNPDSGVLIVSFFPSVPSDTYTVILTLPDGRQAQATFMHTATSALPTPGAGTPAAQAEHSGGT